MSTSGFNMPLQKEKDFRDQKSSTVSKKLFKPLPDKAGEVVNNAVVIPTITPHIWKMFNPSLEEIQKYGMVPSFQSQIPEPLVTFFFCLAVHDVGKFNRPDGSVGFSQVICPIQLNKYLSEVISWGPLFDNPRCAFCEAEQEHWEITNARWDELGIDKKALNRDGYWDQINKDPILAAERRAISALKYKEKFAVSIFDHAKFTGVRQMDDEEDNVYAGNAGDCHT